ncbi:hypothetical protein GCM10010988_28320 [Cnuibacter physcomitrellae]|nr:hypothetical protein GCM10010988_28320 [Cnuibacter physcomitrellae]
MRVWEGGFSRVEARVGVTQALHLSASPSGAITPFVWARKGGFSRFAGREGATQALHLSASPSGADPPLAWAREGRFSRVGGRVGVTAVAAGARLAEWRGSALRMGPGGRVLACRREGGRYRGCSGRPPRRVGRIRSAQGREGRGGRGG